MTGHDQRIVVDKTAKNLASGPSSSTVILSAADAVFHALYAGGFAFLGHYRNKKVLRQSLQKNREKRCVFSESLVKQTSADDLMLFRSGRGKDHSKARRILFLLTFKLAV